MSVIDLFAGAGGWDLAARQLGVDPIGIELNGAACATRAAAGLRTIQADLLQWAGKPPERIRADVADLFATDWPEVDLRTMTGLIASPPCPAFSMAGNGRGRAELGGIVDAVRAHAWPSPTASPDARLLWLPYEWTLRHRPTWTVWEQVPPVLPFFEAVADVLPYHGYFTWAGVLNSADYGTPQTRRRAVLIATIMHPVGEPEPSHAGRWVTMGQALRMCGPWELNPGTFAASGGNRRQYGLDEPAPTIAFGNDLAAWYWHHGAERRPLTHKQAARLQDLPCGHPFAGTQTEVAQQIGNAIPVRLARAVLEQVL